MINEHSNTQRNVQPEAEKAPADLHLVKAGFNAAVTLNVKRVVSHNAWDDVAASLTVLETEQDGHTMFVAFENARRFNTEFRVEHLENYLEQAKDGIEIAVNFKGTNPVRHSGDVRQTPRAQFVDYSPITFK
jgi:hypothetical protein